MDRISRRAVIPAELAGKRLDQVAAVLMSEFSRNRLKLWIQGGQLTIQGAPAQPKLRVQGGEELLLEAELEPVTRVEAEAIALKLVHEDDELFVVDKPAGLVVHPGAGNPSGTLQNALLNLDPRLAAVPRSGIVHRLDKDTSGLLVIARSLTAQQSLVAQIERREVRRTYQAVCQGVLTGGGSVDASIDRHPRERTKMAVRESGRPARTHYRVLERFRAHTHLELELDTGRTHQIRVHMAHIRAPIVGDPVYGGRPRLPRRPSEAVRNCLQSFSRQALHATRLTFLHPASRTEQTYYSEISRDIAHLLTALREDSALAEPR